MKKTAFLLVIALCLTLCGCPVEETPASPQPQSPTVKEVHITAGKIEPGMTAQDVFVEVTIDHQPVPCRVELTGFTSEGYYTMAANEPVPEDFLVRLDVFYSLPKGCTVDDINVTMDCDGGEYDGTGSISVDDNGCEEAWSYAFYGEPQEVSTIHPVNIRVLEFAPGMTVDAVKVEVTIDGELVDARIDMTEHSENGVREMENTEKIPEDSIVRLNIYYYLDHGVTLDDIEVTMDFPGAEYDGTGSLRDHEDGRVEAWSHAFYGTQEESQPQTPPQQETQPETPPQQEAHTHSWIEQTPEFEYVSCTADGVKTYVCSCGETKRETVPAPGHDLAEDSMTEPTCTEIGRKTMHCKRCGAGFITEYPAAGHSWSAWEQDTGRVHKRTCSVCGAEETANHNIPSGSVTCVDCGADIVN